MESYLRLLQIFIYIYIKEKKYHTHQRKIEWRRRQGIGKRITANSSEEKKTLTNFDFSDIPTNFHVTGCNENDKYTQYIRDY